MEILYIQIYLMRKISSHTIMDKEIRTWKYYISSFTFQGEISSHTIMDKEIYEQVMQCNIELHNVTTIITSSATTTTP